MTTAHVPTLLTKVGAQAAQGVLGEDNSGALSRPPS